VALRDSLTDPARRVTEAEWLSANRDAPPNIPPRLLHLLTIVGQAAYPLAPNETPIRRIDECWCDRECWCEREGFRFILRQVVRADWRHLTSRYQGFPTHFWFDGQAVHLWPTPDAEYRVGMIERNEQRMHPEIPRSELYNELAAVPRCALRPRHYFGPDFGPTVFYDAYLDRDGARDKSLNLMKEWLAPRQLEQYEAEGCFDVKGSNGGRYRISNKGTTFNVRELRRTVLGRLLSGDKLCFQPAGVYSQGDVMLAQKIMLERDEPGALKIANRSHT